MTTEENTMEVAVFKWGFCVF